MKKLIRLPLVLFIILLATSCQKEASITPTSPKAPSSSLSTASLAKVSTVNNVSMINNSNTPYEVAFLGSTYTFNIPAGSRLAVAIAAGTYDILVYPAGSSAYVPHTISWDQLPPVVAPRTQFLNVRIEAASSNTLLIH